MTSLVLSLLVMTSSGGLLAERVPAAGMLVGAAPMNAPALENMSLAALTAERAHLMATMPSSGLGIALTAIGGGVLLTGFVVFWYASIVVGVVMMLAAAPLLVIGPILLASSGRARRDQKNQVMAIDRRISELNQGGSAPRPIPNDEVPPPPPMRPPPGVQLTPVEPQFLLASF